MFCRYCGKEIKDGSTVCSECGKDLNGDAKSSKPKAKVNKKIIISAVVACLCLVLIIFGVIYFNGKKAIPEIPESHFINKGDVLFKGNSKGIYVWATIQRHTDGKLDTTINSNPQYNLACYRVLIENKSSADLNIDVSQFTVLLNDNSTVSLFKGEDDALGLLWLNPLIIELNGTDISEKQKTDITVSKDNYCVLEAHYVIGDEEDEKGAIDKTRGIKAGISTSKGRVDIMLNKVNK